MSEIERYIRFLREEASTETVHNLYAGEDAHARLRRNNLRRYLAKMQEQGARSLLVGEAPGYKGCRLTGVPFSSERLLLEHPFFRPDGYELACTPEDACSEQAATIFWEGLESRAEKPLVWNIFPFHPHRSGQPASNRTPTEAELEKGLPYLQGLVELFGIRKIGAVGRKAESKLARLGLPYMYIRHPARGGKAAFLRGLGEWEGWALLAGG